MTLLSCLLFNSYIAIFFTISNLVSVSGQCRIDQRRLLLELNLTSSSYEPSPLGNLVWNQTTDCCSWDGVTCDAGGHVIGLDLSNRLLSSSINDSSSLFRLRHLQRLNLAHNRFMPAYPTGFDKLERLNYLNLSDAGFLGQIPIEISRLTRLVTLDLSIVSSSDLKLEEPNLETLVRNLTRLRFLYLDGVNISATGNDWCQAVSSLTELQVLSMSGCYLSGPLHSSLSKLRSLSVIRLDFNNLSASVPRFFAEFTNLTFLSLSYTNLTGRLPGEIFQIHTLQALDLSYNRLLQGSFPNFPLNASLKTLTLSGTQFVGRVPESLGNLEQLERIELAECNFSGNIPTTIEKLTKLIYLDFSWNSFAGPIPSFSSSENLTELLLYHNQLTGTIHSTDWSVFTKLVNVNIGNNKLSGTIPPTLFTIPSLGTLFLGQNLFNGSLGDFHAKGSLMLYGLDLGSNKLQGEFPMSVFELQGLKLLILSSNNYSGSISMSAFQNLRNLTYLDLSYNRLSIDVTSTNISSLSFSTLRLASCNITEFPGFLKNQSGLIDLDLSNNHIHGEIPNWIWEASILQYLNLSRNSFVEFEGPLNVTSSNLKFLDLHGNRLQGEFPLLPGFEMYYLDYSNNNFSSVLPAQIGDYIQSAAFFSLSSNNFHGSIPRSICSNPQLQVLDLSNNSLTGSIPECLFMNVSLGVMNLRRNNLSGFVPDTFPESCTLQTLDLNQN